MNPADGKLVQLGYWRFNDATWQGESGQIPLGASGLANPPSWSGKDVAVDSTGAANLKYREVEAGGFAWMDEAAGSTIG